MQKQHERKFQYFVYFYKIYFCNSKNLSYLNCRLCDVFEIRLEFCCQYYFENSAILKFIKIE